MPATPSRQPSETRSQRAETKRRVLHLHKLGLAAWQIAERRGIAVHRVVSILRAAGLRARKPISAP